MKMRAYCDAAVCSLAIELRRVVGVEKHIEQIGR